MAMEGINELQQLIESQEKLRDQTTEQANRQKFSQGTSEGFAEPLPLNEQAMEDLGLSGMPPRRTTLLPVSAGPSQAPPQAPDEKLTGEVIPPAPEQEEAIADGPPADITGENAESSPPQTRRTAARTRPSRKPCAIFSAA